MQIVGVSLMAVGVFGLVVFTVHVAWQEIQSLRYIRRLDKWGDRLPWFEDWDSPEDAIYDEDV